MANKYKIIGAVKSYCRDFCCCGQQVEVNLCPAEKCPLWPYRKGLEKGEDLNIAIRALKARCEDCTDGHIQSCEFQDCILYPFRFQKEKRYATEEEKAKLREMYSKEP